MKLHNHSTREEVIAVIQKDGLALEFAPEHFRNDKTIVALAIKQNGFALKYASINLQMDEELIDLALKTLWRNKEFVLSMISERSESLSMISAPLNEDPEVALAAIRKYPTKALQWVSDSLKDNTYLVLFAVKQSGKALQCASNRLKADKMWSWQRSRTAL